MLPNFVVIGAMKAGTTSLWSYLKGQPEIFMAAEDGSSHLAKTGGKEPDYFTAEGTWHRGRQWYESLFSQAGHAKALGEASTTYTKYPVHDGVPERMAGLIPEARLIYLVRDPIERIRSHYEHVIGSEKRPISVPVLDDPKYVTYSRYAFQIDQYLEWFPREQLLVVTSESLREERRLTLRRIFEFLGVDPSWLPDGIDIEHHASRRPLPRAFARGLRRLSGYRRIARAVPPAVRSAYSRMATKEEMPAAERDGGQEGAGHRPFRLAKDVRTELEHRLADDVARLRAFLGDEFDGWGLA
ncbi:MAG: sulfotransferase [Actinomycetota bacterium]